MSSFNVKAFYNEPAGYIGAHMLVIDTDVANLTGSRSQTIDVRVQKEDNNIEVIRESIQYIELSTKACQKTLFARIGGTGAYELGKAKQSPKDAPLEAYYLPWKNGIAYAVRLDDQRDYFATAKVNGCCVFVAGDRHSPLVIHANYSSDRLDLPKEVAEQMSINDALAAYRKHQFKQYTRFYGNFAHQLIDDNIINHKLPISVYDPEFYLARGGIATMYGVRKDDGWTFYFNLQKDKSNVTAELWPAIVGKLP